MNVEDFPESYFDESHTVLGIAAEKGNLEILKLLLEKGTNVNVNMPNNFGRTPLWLASAHGHIDVVRELLKQKGIDLDKDELDEYRVLTRKIAPEMSKPKEKQNKKLIEIFLVNRAKIIKNASKKIDALQKNLQKTKKFCKVSLVARFLGSPLMNS